MDHAVQSPGQVDPEEWQVGVGDRVHQPPDQRGALRDELVVLAAEREDPHARVDP